MLLRFINNSVQQMSAKIKSEKVTESKKDLD